MSRHEPKWVDPIWLWADYAAGHTPALHAAVGRVAVESSVQDELLRQILCDLTSANAWPLFEGQSTDALMGSLRAVLSTGFTEQTHAQHERLVAALDELARLRDLRNAVVHGVWLYLPEVDDAAASDGDAAFYSAKSRIRKAPLQGGFRLSEIDQLAENIRTCTFELADAYRDISRSRLQSEAPPSP